MAKKAKKESTFTQVVNGLLVTVEDKNTITEIEKMRNDINETSHFTTETLERNKIDETTKNELILLLETNPELQPIIKILLGNKEIMKLKENK